MKRVPGNIPNGYKLAILLFLIINRLPFFLVNAFAAGGSSGLFPRWASPEMWPVVTRRMCWRRRLFSLE
nr:hypothetical protein [Dickeya dianthicola]